MALYVVSCTHLVSWIQCLANDEKKNYNSKGLLRYGPRYFHTTICSVHQKFRPFLLISQPITTQLCNLNCRAGLQLIKSNGRMGRITVALDFQ